MSHLMLKDVSKSFGANEVMNGMNFSIKKDEFVSIIGPSGSGKSTIFNLIGGMLAPDHGQILLENKVINGKRGLISYMPQTPSLLPWRTILDNVVLGQELQGKKEISKAKEMLEIAGLADYDKAYPHELSGGMKQRAAFIRALLSPQAVICLDEPFSALDELTRFEMQKWLLSVWETHKRTVLFITHNIEEALYLSDRILVLSQKPSKVISEMEVPFARPRDASILLEEPFLQWKRKVHYTLTGQVVMR
ncbi:ABC transporter ATP-binding protein [Bacillus sp. UNC438CL73TsuS30]|uniref:ABC transporter ATP-binding protein n=1 Tax=Bacillus sp. UNC438CL73TsuS30 TaxID=1340434 RepID=UPI00047E4864|nr:ABC transporter ATP-binding protein [Bacillus sp. UNC438CL73TsuS30]